MTTLIQRDWVQEATKFIRSETDFRPSVGLILGSGLGDFADSLEITSSVNSVEIPHYPLSSVPGHAGKLIFGHVKTNQKLSRPLLVFKGRVHFYETGDLTRVVFPVALAHQLGVRTLLVTNAAGAINREFSAGDLMLIRDLVHLTFLELSFQRPSRKFLQRQSPLARRLPAVLDHRLQEIIRNCAIDMRLQLQEGTYCWLKGPSYETAAEIQMLKKLGADAVGMSTVPEIVMASSLGMKVAGISLISNLATGISSTRLSHQEVTETANRVKQSFTDLLRNVILRV